MLQWHGKTLFTKEKPFLIAQKSLFRHIKNTFQDIKNTFKDIKNASMAIICHMEFSDRYTIWPCAQYAPDLSADQYHYFSVAFPQLFLYGFGAPGGQQWRWLSFMEHIHWLLCYHNRWFHLDHSFPFVAFSIHQKQQCLSSACLHMTRKDFEGDHEDLSQITISELIQAAEEDMHKTPITTQKYVSS